MLQQGFQITRDDGERRAQFMGDVGNEILAHLLQLMQPGDIADQQQVLAIAVAGDVELQADAIVHRRGQLQRLVVVAAVEVLLERRVTHQIADRMAGILGLLQPEQAVGGWVPPLQVAIAVEHDHRILERCGGPLGAIDDALQLASQAQVAALQLVEVVEHVAPDAGRIGRWLVRIAAVQPALQAQQLAQGPDEVTAQAEHQCPGVFATDQTEQQAAAQQQQQAANEGSLPVLIQAMYSEENATVRGWERMLRRRAQLLLEKR